MKICHFDFSKPFELKNGVGVLVVENPKKFVSYCKDFLDQYSGEDGDFIFDENGKNMSFKKCGEIIFDIFNLSYNNKKIIGGVYDNIVATVNNDYFSEYAELKGRILSFVDLVSFDFPLQIEYNAEFSLQEILKVLKVQPSDTSISVVEKIADYFDLSSKFAGTKMFVVVNLRTFLSDADFLSLITHIEYADYSVMFLERMQFKRMKEEPVRIIDNDLCEIIVENEFV